ncbi:hypothetical protein BG452_13445 [Streptomyces sp. CBMA123]|nr:hypothetical protein [Streptomyces sp. CBMA123]
MGDPGRELGQFSGVLGAAHGEDEQRWGGGGFGPGSRVRLRGAGPGLVIGFGAEAVEDDAVLADLSHGAGQGADEVVEVLVGDSDRLGLGGARRRDGLGDGTSRGFGRTGRARSEGVLRVMAGRR